MKYNEHVLKGCRLTQEYNSQAFSMNQKSSYNNANGQSMHGRAVLLKLFSAISFYDQSLKKIVNENLHTMTYLQNAAERKQQQLAEETNDVTDQE
tara:strand:- start:125 stop:409 length:285 start_codon:yes stop_codon:yes gene_type:complete